MRPATRVLAAAVLLGCSARTPRPEPLVDLATLDPTIRVEMPYASRENFTGTALYPVSRCLLRPDVAARVARVQAGLRRDGLGLLVWDCYRPFAVQQRLWALVPDARYVAEPVVRDGRRVSGSKHNRGAAIDATLVDATGRSLAMPTRFDDFSEHAHRGWPGATATARENSERLEAAMAAEGFAPLPTEWWHFDGPGWERYDLLDQPLD